MKELTGAERQAIADWLRQIADEVTEGIESDSIELHKIDLQRGAASFDDRGLEMYVPNGDFELTVEWYNPKHDERSKIVGEKLSDGFWNDDFTSA